MSIWCHSSSSNDVLSSASSSKFLLNVVFCLKGKKCTGKCFVVMGGELSDRSHWWGMMDSQGRYRMGIHYTYCPTISTNDHGVHHNKEVTSTRWLYRYTMNRRTADGQTYWRCFNRTCAGRAVTDINDCLVSANNNHNHPPEVVEVLCKK